jgi:hypothetical protein
MNKARRPRMNLPDSRSGGSYGTKSIFCKLTTFVRTENAFMPTATGYIIRTCRLPARLRNALCILQLKCCNPAATFTISANGIGA